MGRKSKTKLETTFSSQLQQTKPLRHWLLRSLFSVSDPSASPPTQRKAAPHSSASVSSKRERKRLLKNPRGHRIANTTPPPSAVVARLNSEPRALLTGAFCRHQTAKLATFSESRLPLQACQRRRPPEGFEEAAGDSPGDSTKTFRRGVRTPESQPRPRQRQGRSDGGLLRCVPRRLPAGDARPGRSPEARGEPAAACGEAGGGLGKKKSTRELEAHHTARSSP